MGQIELGKPLAVEETPIPGFLRIDLTVHGDNRGWFKENWPVSYTHLTLPTKA